MISLCFDTNLKVYKRERRTGKGHGLSDDEKKNTSDEFELHRFLFRKQGLFRADYRPKLTIPCFVVGIQWQMLAVSRVEC